MQDAERLCSDKPAREDHKKERLQPATQLHWLVRVTSRIQIDLLTDFVLILVYWAGVRCSAMQTSTISSAI